MAAWFVRDVRIHIVVFKIIILKEVIFMAEAVVEGVGEVATPREMVHKLIVETDRLSRALRGPGSVLGGEAGTDMTEQQRRLVQRGMMEVFLKGAEYATRGKWSDVEAAEDVRNVVGEYTEIAGADPDWKLKWEKTLGVGPEQLQRMFEKARSVKGKVAQVLGR